MSRFRRWVVLCLCFASLGAARRASGQTPDGTKPQTTRADVQAAIAEAEKILASPGYSGRIKDVKRREVALLRYRLAEGDFQQGDQIALVVQGENDLTKGFVVGPDRILALPGIGDIPMKGVLRAELQDYLTVQLRKYLKNPVVHAQTTMRISVLGAVARPGFYQVGSDMSIGDAIMAAGGPSGVTDPGKTRVEREGNEIMSKDGFAKALQEGKTLDQLSLRAGDEILVGGERTVKTHTSFLVVALPVLTGVLSLTYLFTQLSR